MKLLRDYMRERGRELLMLLLFCAIFAAVFLLYKIPVEAVFYPAVLCLLLSVVFFGVDFLRVKRRREQLAQIRGLTAAMVSEFPSKETIADNDYQVIIESMLKEAAELENEKELRYQEMLEYYTVWVHQIKTPISAMKLMLQSEDTPEARKLSSELFRIEQYVEMVLAYLRLDSSVNDYVFREHDLDQMIRQSVKQFASEFISRKIRLEYEPIDVKVITDEKWLVFVIGQLMSNALKYTREGSIRIYLKEPKILCMEDTGIGIAPSDLPRIFEKGYTGYNGRSGASSSGIGLYLCKRILKNLGAGISVESVVDKGTKIFIDLEQYDLKTE